MVVLQVISVRVIANNLQNLSHGNLLILHSVGYCQSAGIVFGTVTQVVYCCAIACREQNLCCSMV